MDYIIQKTQRKVKLKKRVDAVPVSVKSIHNEKMAYFQNLQDTVLPQKLKQLKIIEKNKNPSYEELQKKNNLLKEIQVIKNKEEEIDYFLKTCKILDEYFMLDSGMQKENHEECSNKNTTEYRKTEVIREYYTVLNIDLPKQYQPDLNINVSYCEKCNTNEFIMEHTIEGLVCKNCGLILIRSNISHELSYKDKQFVEHTVVLDYKRVDYFKQWLNQIQAKEQTDIPIEVIDILIMQLKTERISNTSKITNSLIKRLLKKTNNSKYYEHIPYIINIINKVPPLNIPEYIEQKLIAMFEEIQVPWET